MPALVEAYEVGISLVLQNGVSDGIALIRRDLATLDQAIAATSQNLTRLQQAAGISLPQAIPQQTKPPIVSATAAVPAEATARTASIPAPAATPGTVAAPSARTVAMEMPATMPRGVIARSQPVEARLPPPPIPPPPPGPIRIPVAAPAPVPTAPASPAANRLAPQPPAAPAPRRAAADVEPMERQHSRPPLPSAPAAPTARVTRSDTVPPAATARPLALPQAASPMSGVPKGENAASAPVASRRSHSVVHHAAAPGHHQPLRADGIEPRAPESFTRARTPAAPPPIVPPVPDAASRPSFAQTQPAPFAPVAQSPGNITLQGDIILDGTRVGRWMTTTLARQAARPPAGPTGPDPRQTPLWSGQAQGF